VSKTVKFIWVFAVFVLHACGDVSLGMKYQRHALRGAGHDSLYCYRLTWGLDAQSMVISTNKDVCQGFDSAKDICFGTGYTEIYYKIRNDTLQVYSNKAPLFPTDLRYHVVVRIVGHDDYPKFEEACKQGQLEKMAFDEDTVVHDVPCSPVRTGSQYSIKFKG
jgi:hypothetical protein